MLTWLDNISPKRFVLLGVAIILLSLLMVGFSARAGEKRIGSEIKEHRVKLLAVEKEKTRRKTSSSARYVYHFAATVEIGGETIRLVPGNAEHYYRRYDEGDMVTVYEYNGRYSFAKTDFTVGGPMTTVAVLLLAGGSVVTVLGMAAAMQRRGRQNA